MHVEKVGEGAGSLPKTCQSAPEGPKNPAAEIDDFDKSHARLHQFEQSSNYQWLNRISVAVQKDVEMEVGGYHDVGRKNTLD